MSNKIGIGYDVHRFVDGRELFLGGIKIPYTRGLDGHSDADVLIHAICDAVLGALGEGDIGEHFPDTDSQYKGISSVKLLEVVCELMKEKGFIIGNVDTVIVAQEPNLKAHKDEMRSLLADVLGVDRSCVNIKATTTEGMGFVGRKEGIAAYATVILNNK